MSNQKVSVSRLVSFLKMKLDQDLSLQNMIVHGELSNFTAHRSGHLYFTLKDERARIQCVMFSGQAQRLKFSPKDGDNVLICASTSIFEASGQLQLYVKTIQLDGLGDYYIQLNELKKRLYEDGYFDEAHKQKFKKYPEKIGIITGSESAAYNDLIKTFELRWPMAQLTIFETLVQGPSASAMIIKALLEADTLELDAIIIARGGGSIEDLWSFNDEQLAKIIYHATTPIICGIGHETDVTVAELVADARASTPTATVIAVSPDYHDVLGLIAKKREQLEYLMLQKLKAAQNQFMSLINSVIFENKDYLLMESTLKLEYLTKRLMNSQAWMANHQQRILKCKETLSYLMTSRMRQEEYHLAKNITLLDAYSPLKILKRGYNLAYIDQTLIASVGQLKKEALVTIQLSDGQFDAQIKEIRHD